DSGRVVQDDGAARVPDGPDPSPLRARRVERAEGHHAIRDSRDRVCVDESHHAQAALMDFSVTGKRVTVVGAARSGRAAPELLAGRGADVTLSDVNAHVSGVESLRALGVRLELGGHELQTFTGADLIIASPGVPPDLPVLTAARQTGVPVIGEVELA